MIYKTGATLRKNINTKHQLDPEEVDTVVKNNSIEKELRKSELKIRELQDRIEDLALECEISRLKA